jgi:hypothetical protein
MTHTTSKFAFLALAATISSTVSTQVQAQDAFAALDVAVRPAAAEEMEGLAYDLVVAGRGLDEAAGLYRRAAALRGTGDPMGADNLRIAGYIEFYRNRPQLAVTTLTEAGEAFLALGDVERAAESFIDGAWVAMKADMPAAVLELSERARLLSRSPLLEADERFALARRLGPAAGTE